ncbi:MAG: hypothetical protein Q8O41_03045, partial [Candidatus Methanoperedens sp.]|nr:hypothetical protein [Candidatus Methanoperedens sp.]
WSGDPRRLIGDVILLLSYSTFFTLMTRAFMLLGMIEYYGKEMYPIPHAASPNTGFAAHCVRPNAFSTSQSPKPLYAIVSKKLEHQFF